MSNLDQILSIMRSPQNGMRQKHPAIIDINGKAGWLHLTGGAQHSIMAWLNEFHKDQFQELKKAEVEKYDKEVFVILAEPEKRYWNGITEWSTCWGTHEWWQHDDIMEWFPHFDRYTLRYSEMIDQVPQVKHFLKLDEGLSDKMEALGERLGLNCPYGIDKIRPRYKKDPDVVKIHKEIMPKFKNLVNDSPELRQKLEDYLAPDVWYYAKAK
jgi:hypothetical protein